MNDYGDEQHLGGPDGRNEWFVEARRRVHTPGLMLQWFGIISLIIVVLRLLVVIVDIDMIAKPLYDLQVDANKNQPPQNKQNLPPYEEYAKSFSTQMLIDGLLGMVGSFFILFGGMKMTYLQSYGMSITGAIFAIVPCNCCCCIGMIPGIWALVALLNSDVKLAFARVSAVGAME